MLSYYLFYHRSKLLSLTSDKKMPGRTKDPEHVENFIPKLGDMTRKYTVAIYFWLIQQQKAAKVVKF